MSALRSTIEDLAANSDVQSALLRYRVGDTQERIKALEQVREELKQLIEIETEVIALRQKADGLIDSKSQLDRAAAMRTIAVSVLLDENMHSLAEIQSPTRCASVVRARWQVIQALHERGYGVTLIGRFLNRDHGSISNALKGGSKKAAPRPLALSMARRRS